MPSRPAERGMRGGAGGWPNVDLLGLPGGRDRLDTPALLVDRPALGRNIARMAAFAAGCGIALRPHVKTHKSVEIARHQVAAGAVGVSCATLGEAEVMVRAGIPSVLVTSPIVTEIKVGRLLALARAAGPGGLSVVADDPGNVADLARGAREIGFPLDVLVDHAAGYGRTGVADTAAAIDLADRIGAAPSLCLRGLQAYAGHIQHITGRVAREEAATSVRRAVAEIVAGAARAGIAFETVTGVGTGTHDLDASDGVFTEIQPGSYVFMDVEYDRVLADGAEAARFEIALFVQTAVVSTNAPDRVTVDGGTKCFATDAGLPVPVRGVGPGSTYAFAGDEHGRLTPAGARPGLGARIEFATPHCDPTVNLHDVYHVVEGDTLVDLWAIDARGRH